MSIELTRLPTQSVDSTGTISTSAVCAADVDDNYDNCDNCDRRNELQSPENSDMTTALPSPTASAATDVGFRERTEETVHESSYGADTHTSHSHTTTHGRQSDELAPSSRAAPASIKSPSQLSTDSSTFRHTLGILLLLLVVTLWVISNFITHALFSDDTYSKPYLVAYIGSGVFCVYLVPWVVGGGVKELVHGWRKGERPWKWHAKSGMRGGYVRIADGEGGGDGEGEEEGEAEEAGEEEGEEKEEWERLRKLGLYDTIRLSVEFSIFWFTANYFSSVCYKFTNVASGTILGSTSSIWTLILCALFRVERFTWSKAAAVIISLLGVLLISEIDMSTSPSTTTGHRSPLQILLGNIFALLAAVFYGIYVTLLKLRVGDESRLDVHLLFGFSGLIIITCTWPVILLYHFTNIEKFELPPERKVWVMLAFNWTINIISDLSWAYAMLLTTPLLATMGLSMSIPLAMVGQMVITGRVAGIGYWVGVVAVFGGFVLVAKEDTKEEEERKEARERRKLVEGVREEVDFGDDEGRERGSRVLVT